MPIALKKIRQRAFERQSGRCFYCSGPVCNAEVSDGQFKTFAKTLGISVRQAKRLRCTAEHLCAVKDGGKNAQSNIVAACQFCNSKRHSRKRPPEPPEYKRYVQSRIRQGRWHPKEILRHVRVA